MSTGIACTTTASDCRPSIIVTSGRVRFGDILTHKRVICVSYEALVKSVIALKRAKRESDVTTNGPDEVVVTYLDHYVVLSPGVTCSTHDLVRDIPKGSSIFRVIDEWDSFFTMYPLAVVNKSTWSFPRLKPSSTTSSTLSELASSFLTNILNPIAPELEPVHEKTLFIRGGGQHGTILMGAVAAILETEDASRPFERFAGASFGAALAALAAVMMTTTTDVTVMSRLLDVCEKLRLGYPDGAERVLNGDVALTFSRELVPAGMAERTLGELNLPLDILVTRTSDCATVVLNAKTAPHVPLVEALHASMGIPLFIGCRVVDGVEYTDGDIFAHTYIEKFTNPESAVLRLAANDDRETCMFDRHVTEVFAGQGSLAEKIVKLLDVVMASLIDRYTFTGIARRLYMSIRDETVTVCGGKVGSTAWHLLNFDHGFQEVMSTSSFSS